MTLKIVNTMLPAVVILGIISAVIAAPSEIGSEGSLIGSWSIVIAICAFTTTVFILVGCALFCPKQPNYQANDDAFFGDIRIGAPPVVEFGMYPPVESTPAPVRASSGGRIVFEPLPDINEMRRRLAIGDDVASRPVDINERRLRPRIGRLQRERQQSGGSLDDDLDEDGAAGDKLKLDYILANSRQNFPRTHLQYIRELGSSWFGKVLQGEGQGILPGHRRTKVVINILSDEADITEQLMFLQEGQPYREVDNANVMRLLGQCVESTPYLSIYEYCTLGDLKSYLRTHRSSVEQLDRQGLLLNFACDFAAGLQALHQQYFIHRDFALRNCLLTEDLIVKVGDYGLAEEMFKDDYYCKEGSRVGIPIRWLSPEVIHVETSTAANNRTTLELSLRGLNKESNIWSFGVALWELVTFGAQPYADLSNDHVIRLVLMERSLKLARPEAPVSHLDRLYELMQMCWLDSVRRPSLRELRIMLLHLRSSRDQADSTAFDLKWNQLKPRQPVTVDIQHCDGGSSRLSDITSHSTVATIHRSHFGAERPTSFESDFSSLNASLLAQAGSRQTSLRSAAETPDSLPTYCGSSSFSEAGNEMTSPINELSFAAEIGATSSQKGAPSLGDDSLSSLANWGGVGVAMGTPGDKKGDVGVSLHRGEVVVGEKVGDKKSDVEILEHYGEVGKKICDRKDSDIVAGQRGEVGDRNGGGLGAESGGFTVTMGDGVVVHQKGDILSVDSEKRNNSPKDLENSKKSDTVVINSALSNIDTEKNVSENSPKLEKPSPKSVSEGNGVKTSEHLDQSAIGAALNLSATSEPDEKIAQNAQRNGTLADATNTLDSGVNSCEDLSMNADNCANGDSEKTHSNAAEKAKSDVAKSHETKSDDAKELKKSNVGNELKISNEGNEFELNLSSENLNRDDVEEFSTVSQNSKDKADKNNEELSLRLSEEEQSLPPTSLSNGSYFGDDMLPLSSREFLSAGEFQSLEFPGNLPPSLEIPSGVFPEPTVRLTPNSSASSLSTPPVSMDKMRTNYSTYLHTVATSFDSESSDTADDFSFSHPPGRGGFLPEATLPRLEEDSAMDGFKMDDFENGIKRENVNSSLTNQDFENGIKSENAKLNLTNQGEDNEKGEESGMKGSIRLADEMERLAAGEEFLGDDTEFGKYYQGTT